MFTEIKPHRLWSQIGLYTLIGSIAAAVALALFDGVWRGPMAIDYVNSDHRGALLMLATWITDFRYLAEQGVYAATIFFVGAKFFETRTVFTVGFDRQDTAKISLKGPDDDNIVWIGRRYANRMEAETIAEAFAERLKDSAA